MPPRQSRPRNTQQQPAAAPSNVFNLDAIERDGDPGPFVALIGGIEFTFADVRDRDWQLNEQLRAKGDGREAMRVSLGDEQWQQFLTLPEGTVSDRKLEILANKVAEHFAVGEDSA